MVCLEAVDQYITQPQELYNPKNAPKQGPLRKTSTKLCRPVIRFMRALCGICSVHCPSSAALIMPGTSPICLVSTISLTKSNELPDEPEAIPHKAAAELVLSHQSPQGPGLETPLFPEMPGLEGC